MIQSLQWDVTRVLLPLLMVDFSHCWTHPQKIIMIDSKKQVAPKISAIATS